MRTNANHSPEVTVNGWHYDPTEQAWTAKTGPLTWSIVKGDLDDPPSWRPTAH